MRVPRSRRSGARDKAAVPLDQARQYCEDVALVVARAGDPATLDSARPRARPTEMANFLRLAAGRRRVCSAQLE